MKQGTKGLHVRSVNERKEAVEDTFGGVCSGMVLPFPKTVPGPYRQALHLQHMTNWKEPIFHGRSLSQNIQTEMKSFNAI